MSIGLPELALIALQLVPVIITVVLIVFAVKAARGVGRDLDKRDARIAALEKEVAELRQHVK